MSSTREKCFYKQYWAKYFQQSRQIRQNRTGSQNFHICFCVIFDCYCQGFISGREAGIAAEKMKFSIKDFFSKRD